MNTRKLLASTALTTGLLIAGSLSAVAGPTLDLGGYGGPITLKFTDYESFLNPTTGVTSPVPVAGDENFGIFIVSSIDNTNNTAIWTSGTNANGNEILAGVFNDINIKTVMTTSLGTETTTNTGGVFNLYLVPKTGAALDQGTGNYCGSGVGSLCYTGITDVGTQLLTMDLTGGIDPSDSSVTLVAKLNATVTPATGSASGYGSISGPDAAQFGPTTFITDNFGPNAPCHVLGAYNSADCSNFAVVSNDPISATAVPEPASLGLLGMALLGFGGFGWFRRRKQAGTASLAA